MRICFIADLLSPTSRAFIELVAGQCEAWAVDLREPDRAFAWTRTTDSAPRCAARQGLRAEIKSRLLSAAPYASTWFADTLRLQRALWASDRLSRTISATRPDIVHALRIPFEGIAAASACGGAKLILSVWGNDFTLHCESSRIVRHHTAKALSRADGLLADCRRDLNLAVSHGFDASKPSTSVPGSGGIDPAIFFPAPSSTSVGPRLVVNTRGPRAYVRTENFIRAIPLVLKSVSDVKFLAVGLAGHQQYERLVRNLGIENSIELLPVMSQPDIANLYRKATVFVSPSEHDGTPNSLLEAMACGAIPVLGHLEPLREWIQDSVNGLFCDPKSPESIAGAIITALRDSNLRETTRATNLKLVDERASRNISRDTIMRFYRTILGPAQQ